MQTIWILWVIYAGHATALGWYETESLCLQQMQKAERQLENRNPGLTCVKHTPGLINGIPG